MLLTKERNAEPIAGYRLLEPLGRGGFGEVWKCEAPGGLCKAIKFVPANDDLDDAPAPADEELKAIQHVKSLRHPFLLSMERVEVIDDELVIVMELADKNLQDLYQERRAAGQTGIERDELVGYLREAADVLDLMNLRHGLQHLDIKPGNLFLVSDHVKVADFGLVRSLAERGGAGVSLGALTALYAAPELFRNTISSSSDQYSLAIVYQELLSGTLPFTGKNSRQLMVQHSTTEPNLSALPEADQAVVARALAKDPTQRYPTCSDFISALAAGAQKGRNTPLQTDTRREGVAGGTTSLRPAHGQCLPGHQFLACLGRTPFTEVWEAQTGDGRRWLVKFLYGVVGRDAAREKEAVRCLEALRHPALPSLRLVSAGPGCLAAVTDRLTESLRDRYQAPRGTPTEGHTRGLPRGRLLGWLRPVAEALDDLARHPGLRHLGLTPRHLLFDDDRLRIADFGVLPLLWQPAGQLQGQLQARYAAPELFEQRQSETCDQYSLAVLFQEMLTGTPPWRGRRTGAPNLASLDEADREVLLRALDAVPGRRFGSCTELIAALEAAGGMRGGESAEVPEATGPAALVAELIVEAGGGSVLVRPEMWGQTPAGALQLQHHFAARLPATGARTSFESFRRQWNAQVLAEADNALQLQVRLPGSFWQRWLGGLTTLAVDLRWARPEGTGRADLAVRIAAAERCKVDDDLLRQVAPLLLDSLRSQLEAHPERRGRKRLPWRHPVRATFQVDGDQWSEPIDGEGKDISLTGMGLYLPRVLPGPQVRLDFTTPTRPEGVQLCGNCVRVQRCPDGRYQAGVSFL
jgi:serine/threonine protein kinase